MASDLTSPVDGSDRVIQGSRRPDGTYRKDVRVKAGYTPPDEQIAFTSRASQFRNGPGRVPGLVIEEAPQEPAERAKGKSAKRNEAKRKKKELEQQQTDSQLASEASSLRLNDGSNSLRDESSSGKAETQHARDASSKAEQTSKAAPPDHAQPSMPSAGEDKVDLEKRLRALRKKLRQVEALRDKQKGGQSLSQEEHDKLKNGLEWEAAVNELESSIAAS